MKLKPVLIYSTILAIVAFIVIALVLEKATTNTGPQVNESVKDFETVAIAAPILLLLSAPSLFFGIIIVVGGVIMYLLNSATKQGGKIPLGLLLIIISLPVLACLLCSLLASGLQR